MLLFCLRMFDFSLKICYNSINGGSIMKIIYGRKKRDIYYIDDENMLVKDKEGNVIKLYETTEGVSDTNLSEFLDMLFHSFYEEQNDFKYRCRQAKIDGIEWTTRWNNESLFNA